MTDRTIREARLIVLYERDAIFPRNISGRDDHEFFPIDSWAKDEFFDLAPGNVATNGGAVEHAR